MKGSVATEPVLSNGSYVTYLVFFLPEKVPIQS
jgi:hypothetical protein